MVMGKEEGGGKRKGGEEKRTKGEGGQGVEDDWGEGGRWKREDVRGRRWMGEQDGWRMGKEGGKERQDGGGRSAFC